MLVKAAIAAAALAAVAVPLSQVNYPQLYNGMYPVNGLKRDVLGLCQVTRPTFIRALGSDRVHCYDSMPDAIDLAIGWVRTADRLAALRHTPTAIDRAEKKLAEAVLRGRVGLPALRRFTGYLAPAAVRRPCPATVLALPAGGAAPAPGEADARLARQIADGDGTAALAALGLAPQARQPVDGPRERPRALPILPLDGDAAPPLALAAGCRTPA